MARGFIYYMTTDKTIEPSIDESDYYEKLDGMGCDYVQNETKESSEYPLECLSGMLSEMGAVVTREDMPEGYAFSFRFDKVEQMLQDYFRPKLEKLKKEAAELELEKVIRSAPNLDWICNNEFTDAVELEDPEETESSFSSMDNFIRGIHPGVEYYVHDKTVLMH